MGKPLTITFLRRPASCRCQVRSRRKREKVQKAYDYLMKKKGPEEWESSYRDFIKKHDNFLRKHPDADALQRRRPLQFLEEAGIECALWPSLSWCTEMTETLERATDVRRLQRQGGDRAVLNDDPGQDTPGERHSVKRSFMHKVLSPVIGYGQDFELLQFVYDLCMWSRIGGGKGETFSPLFWKEKHQALSDMQRQCKFPRLFKRRWPRGNLVSHITSSSWTEWRRAAGVACSPLAWRPCTPPMSSRR